MNDIARKALPLIVLALFAVQPADARQGHRGKAGSAAQAPVDVAIIRRAGSWTMTHTTLAFDVTGVEGGMANLAAAGKASVGKPDVGGPVCLAAKTTRKDNLAARLREMIQIGPEWKVVRSTVTGGKVDFFATMNDPEQGTAEMTIAGRISPTLTSLTMTTDSHQPAPGTGHIHTVMQQENVRVSDCTPGEDTFGLIPDKPVICNDQSECVSAHRAVIFV